MEHVMPLSISDEGSGFFRLITNPHCIEQCCVYPTDDPTLLRTRAYVYAVLKGSGRKPYCPIVSMVEEANAYRVRIFSDSPDDIDFSIVLDILEAKYRELSPAPTYARQPLDLTTVVAAFSHLQTNDEAFCRVLAEVHTAHRFRFIRQGLMIAYMHPHHSLGSSSLKRQKAGSEPLYLSAIPLIVIRRMIPADDRFMRTEEEKRAYAQFFGAGAHSAGWNVDS